MNAKLSASISALIEPMLKNDGIELVDIEFEGRGRRKTIRLLIDKPGGVNIKDCRNINIMVEPVLRVNKLINSGYILEVASPGLDRRLKSESDFRRVLGRSVEVSTNTPIDDCKQFVGKVNQVLNGVVELIDASGKHIQIPMSQIARAQLEIKF